MKLSKRATSFVLLAAILTLFSCGEEAPDNIPEETTAPSTETAQPTDGLPDTDMGGFSFNILHHNKNWLTWAETQLVAEEENGDLLNDAMYKRQSYIEDRFKCKLNVTEVDKVADIMAQSVLSGDNEYDIIFQYGINTLGNVEYLADFSNIPHLKLDADYWNPDATSIFRIGTKQVAVAGNWSLSYLSGSQGFLFNKDLYEKLKIEDNVYDLVRDGKWTTDKFFGIAKKAPADLNGDAVMDADDQYGVVGSVKAFYNTLITGAGIKYVRMDKDNYPYFDVPGNEKTISFFEKLVQTVSSDPDIYYDDNDGVDGGNVDKFPNGQILFQQAGVFGITNQRYREMKADFGILPAPKYDENQDKYYSYTNIGEIATLPRSYDTSRAENIGILMEAMSFYSQQNIVDTYKKVILQTKMTRDDDSSEMLQYIFDGISFDYGIVVWQNDIGNVFMKQVFKPKSDTVASTVDTIKTSLEAKIEELKTAVVDMP